MPKTKLEKHLDALAEETSGGAHDAVTFSGKGLGFLRDLFKSSKKREDDDEESASDDDDMEDELFDDEDEEGDEEREDDAERDEDEDEDEDDDDDKREVRKSRRVKKSRRVRKGRRGSRDLSYDDANGGDLEEVDYEDDEDPGQEGDEEIISNHGRRVNARNAVKKSMNRFETEYADVLDASDAIREVARTQRLLAKSQHQTTAELQRSIRVLAKGLQASLKAQASLAKDLELIKKQPAGGIPSPGYITLAKSQGQKGPRRLSKSDMTDVVNDAMLDGLVDAKMVAKLAVLNTQQELTDYYNSLPASVRERM